MGLIESIFASPIAVLLLAVDLASFLALCMSEHKGKSFLAICGSSLGLLFLYSEAFRQQIASLLPIPINTGKLAEGVQQGGRNVLAGTEQMLILGVILLGFGLVASWTGSRKLGGFIFAISALIILATLFGFFGPIISSLG
jgi:hypothetical protein